MTQVSRGRALLRHPSPHQVGFMKDGKVVALKVEHYSNAGNTMDLSQSVSTGTPASWGWGGAWEVKGGPHSHPGSGLLSSCLLP